MARRTPQSHALRTDPAAPRAQHHHQLDIRGRPPLPLHDALLNQLTRGLYGSSSRFATIPSRS